MKIAVLIKQVPGSESPLPLNNDQLWVDETQVTYSMNPPDNYALEEALLIKEEIGEGEVVAVSMGPERAGKTIREGLAKGADRGIHLKEDGQIEKDPLSIAKSFASVLQDENFNLILSGLQSDDTGMGQTGILIGELLGMSTATLVIETKILDSQIRVKRELESGWFQWLQVPLPASLSIQSGLNTPRYPSLKGIMGAKKKEVKTIDSADHRISEQVQTINKVFIPNASKQTEVIEGSVDDTVDRIISILKSDIKVL